MKVISQSRYESPIGFLRLSHSLTVIKLDLSQRGEVSRVQRSFTNGMQPLRVSSRRFSAVTTPHTSAEHHLAGHPAVYYE